MVRRQPREVRIPRGEQPRATCHLYCAGAGSIERAMDVWPSGAVLEGLMHTIAACVRAQRSARVLAVARLGARRCVRQREIASSRMGSTAGVPRTRLAGRPAILQPLCRRTQTPPGWATQARGRCGPSQLCSHPAHLPLAEVGTLLEPVQARTRPSVHHRFFSGASGRRCGLGDASQCRWPHPCRTIPDERRCVRQLPPLAETRPTWVFIFA